MEFYADPDVTCAECGAKSVTVAAGLVLYACAACLARAADVLRLHEATAPERAREKGTRCDEASHNGNGAACYVHESTHFIVLG